MPRTSLYLHHLHFAHSSIHIFCNNAFLFPVGHLGPSFALHPDRHYLFPPCVYLQVSQMDSLSVHVVVHCPLVLDSVSHLSSSQTWPHISPIHKCTILSVTPVNAFSFSVVVLSATSQLCRSFPLFPHLFRPRIVRC